MNTAIGSGIVSLPLHASSEADTVEDADEIYGRENQRNSEQYNHGEIDELRQDGPRAG